MSNKNSRFANKLLWGIIVAAVWIGIWFLLDAIIGQKLLFVSPYETVARIVELMGTGEFWLSIASSMVRILIGLALAIIIGSLLAFLCHYVPIADMFFKPLLHLIRSTPVASFIILAIVWLTTGKVPMFTSFLMALPIVFGNIKTGFQEIRPKLIEVTEVYHFSFSKKLKNLILPSLLPYSLTAVKTSVGFAWKAGIAAEVLCRPDFSMGNALYNAKVYLDTPNLFAWTTVIILLSLLIEKALVLLVKAVSTKLDYEEGENGNG